MPSVGEDLWIASGLRPQGLAVLGTKGIGIQDEGWLTGAHEEA